MVHGKVRDEDDMEAEFRGLATVVRFFVAMRNLLGDS
jgi:hypothetical protein